MAPEPRFPILLTHDVLLTRIAELARVIGASYRDEPPCFVAIMEGARTFATHLLRLLPGRPPFHEVRASSYGSGTVSQGKVLIASVVPPVAGKRVIAIEDIVDTGRTIERLSGWLGAHGATQIQVVTLLSKPSRRVVPVTIDWVGFEIPDEFVIGFGMDVAGKYRELPHIAIYERALEGA